MTLRSSVHDHRVGGGSRRWLGLVALTIGVAMIIVDATIVNVAIPSIIRDLSIGITQAEWANSIYSLVFAALLISVGRVGDVGGRRRVFVLGLLVFLAASLVTALAPNGSVLLAGRFLQGVGAALILPSTLAIVNATFRGRERAIAFGIWGSTIGGMAGPRCSLDGARHIRGDGRLLADIDERVRATDERDPQGCFLEDVGTC